MDNSDYETIRRRMYDRGIPREEQDLLIKLAVDSGQMHLLEDKYGDDGDV